MYLSVVFPVKNQSEKLVHNIRKRAIPFFDKLGITFEIIVVYDGSDEWNRQELENSIHFLKPWTRLAPFEMKFGKGHNVKKGIELAEGDYVLFMDADLATNLDVFREMFEHLEEYDAQIASRHVKGAKIIGKQGALRTLMGKASRKIVREMFDLPYMDTQCGFKMFETRIAKEMAKRQITDGFAFDVEYLYYLTRNGYKVREVPCVWEDDPDSTISSPLKSGYRFYKDLRKIRKNRKNYLERGETDAD